MRVLSLFSGIGGFELGIERAFYNRRSTEAPDSKKGQHQSVSKSGDGNGWGSNATCVGFSEVNKYAISVYERHFPGTKNFGDISRVSTDDVPDFDLLTFGWPCQDNSIAGKRKGQKVGTRSGLLFEAVRILRAKQPKYFVAENVPGLFSVNGGCDFYEAIRLFTDIGYDCQWQVLNTRWFLPQNRERIYIVGHLRRVRRPKVFPIGENGGPHFQHQGGAEPKAKPASSITTREGGRKENNFVITEAVKESQKNSQGARVYESNGVSTTINSGAKTGLYLIKDDDPNKH